jgi:tetratricopeptide (TPR) repeat protein
LRAALLTTQGGALRDIGDLDEAEKSALKAIKNFPDSHNPYTLMGALCYDTGRHDEGYKWFDEAVKRGAQPNDQDSEIKRILRKGQNHSLIEYLLKKDPFRFAWVKEFAKNIFNRKKS